LLNGDTRGGRIADATTSLAAGASDTDELAAADDAAARTSVRPASADRTTNDNDITAAYT
jgi:hypothetical protein